ncbi:acyl carrier protein [compost metagenome]
MSTLQDEIKLLIISALELEDMTADDIDADAPLFGEGLGLDSIDALELGVALKKKYNIKLEANDPVTKAHFASVASLARFVAQQQETQA